MKAPMSKAELIQAIQTARTEWDTLIARVPGHRLSESVAPGAWSIKDIIAHITEYDRWLALGLALRTCKTITSDFRSEPEGRRGQGQSVRLVQQGSH